MKRPVLPIRWRLTLFYTALVALLLTLFAVYLYATLTQTLAAELDRTLADRADQLSQTSEVRRVGITGQGLVILRPDVFADADTFVQVTSFRDPTEQAKSSNLDRLQLPIPPYADDIRRTGQPRYDTIEAGPVQLRVYNALLFINERPEGLIQVARITRELDQTAANLSRLLIAGIAAAVLVSLVAGHFLSGRSLRPIQRVSHAAREIGVLRDFRRRVPYAGPDDEVGRLAATFNDMLRELEAAYADVNSALAAQRRFVADASHELRTPLTAIRGNAELMQRVPDMDPGDLRESIDEIAREAQRMTRLVNNLLALARADAGQQLQKTNFPLAPVIEEVAAQARHLSSEVPVYLGPIAGVELFGDRDYVKQMLLILLDNALKYTRPPGWVAISAVAGGDQVRVAVEDTGAGIAPEHLPHIFERFYRADFSRSSSGTGLGLSIGRWIADQHGARIDVSSEVGRGSVFTVTFPGVAKPSPTRQLPSPPAQESTLGTELATRT